MIYLELFWTFFQIGLFSIGGGYAAMPLIQSHVVESNNWLTLTEFSDLITIAEITPGPIAINAATFVGTRICGIGGALIATLGCVLPSIIIVSLLAFLYYKFKKLTAMQSVLKALRPAVVAAIASAGLTILILSFWGEKGFSSDVTDLNIFAVIIAGVSLFILRKFKINPIYVMIGSGILGTVYCLL